MRLEDTTVAIEPRSVGACLDLAFVFYREHARPFVTLTLLFALPAALLSALYARAFGGNAWIAAALTFFAASPLLSALLVSAAGRAVFGEALGVREAFGGLRGVLWPLVSSLVTSRLLVVLAALPCLGVTGFLLDTYYGFLAEIIVLERLRGATAWRRSGALVRPTYLNLVWRRSALLSLFVVTTIAAVSLVDQASDLLLGRGVISGHIESRFFGESLELVLADPLALALVTAGAWLVHPLTRLAWFFSYLDVRIRKEGWDLELGFRIEARRLEATA